MKRTTQGFSHLLLTLTLLLSMVGCSGKEPPQANRSDAAPTALTIADLKEILSALDASNSTLTYCNGENEETHPANAAIRTKKYIKELQDYDVWETCQPPENWNPSGEYYYKFHGDGISLISYQNGFTGLQPFHVTTDTGDGWFRLSDIPAEQDNSAQQFGWMVYDTFGKWYQNQKGGLQMNPNADYLGIVTLLRGLREQGLISGSEAKKIAARLKARLGADIIISL